jgi:hypothetical protein
MTQTIWLVAALGMRIIDLEKSQTCAAKPARLAENEIVSPGAQV